MLSWVVRVVVWVTMMMVMMEIPIPIPIPPHFAQVKDGGPGGGIDIDVGQDIVAGGHKGLDRLARLVVQVVSEEPVGVKRR